MPLAIRSTSSNTNSCPTHIAGDVLLAVSWGISAGSFNSGWTVLSNFGTVWYYDNFTVAYRVATDGNTGAPWASYTGASGFSYGSRVYAIQGALATGPIAEIVNSASSIGGYSFTIPSIATDPVVVNSGSAVFNGSSSYLSMPATSATQPGTGDFTVEAWVKLSNLSHTGAIASNYNGSSGWWFGYRNGYSGFSIGNGDNWPILTIPYQRMGEWVHVAFCRSGYGLRGFLDGTQVVSTAVGPGSYGGDNWTGGSTTRVGVLSTGTGQYHAGSISNVRFTKTAEYQSNFTPTGPLTAVAGTGLLTCTSSSSISDVSGTNTSITNSNVTTSSSNPFNTSKNLRFTFVQGVGGGGNSDMKTAFSLTADGIKNVVLDDYFGIWTGGIGEIAASSPSNWYKRYATLSILPALPASGFFTMF